MDSQNFVVNISELLFFSGSYRSYELGIEILRSKARESSVRHLSRLQILVEIERRFIKAIAKVIMDRSKEMQSYQAVQHKLVIFFFQFLLVTYRCVRMNV